MNLCVASQCVFNIVSISLSTQSGNFWIHLLMLLFVGIKISGDCFYIIIIIIIMEAAR